MDKTSIKNFAIQARKDLIAGVKQKAYEYGIDEKTTGNEAPTGALLNGRILTSEEQSQRNELLNLIRTKGYEQVMEEVAYTWFNRFIALRFMEVNEYLPSRIRVFTNEQNAFQPEILTEALHLNLEGLDKTKVISLLEANQTEELYKYLLITQCNDLNSALPEMFEKIQNYTELLFPNNLLKDGSVLNNMVFGIPKDDWKEAVEIIGWLYQYYIAEPKDMLINAKLTYKTEDIPFVTQLFTSDWIVRYMVENSLGRLWIEGHPSDVLKSTWKYYLEETEQEPEGALQMQKIRADSANIKPEEIRVIDPCMGSGHILVYAFDVLMQIYVATGYSERDAAKSILKNNLFGLDIDNRAYQLSYFAVMMKARKYCHEILFADISPNLYSIQESNFVTTELIDYVADGDANIKYDLQAIIETLYDAKEYGSILNIPEVNYKKIFNRLEDIQSNTLNDLQHLAFRHSITNIVIPLLNQAQVMSQKYNVVCTNPPYLNSKYMPEKLKTYIDSNYGDYKSDMFASFIIKSSQLCKDNGHIGMLTPYVWMFISSYETLRENILTYRTISSLVQLEYNAFESACVPVCAFTLRNYKCNVAGEYIKLSDFKGIEVQAPKTLEAVENKNCGYRFSSKQENFVKIPGMPIAFWMSETIFKAFNNASKIGEIAEGKVGVQTGNNDLFLKLWHEINVNRITFDSKDGNNVCWVPHNKGGDYRKWYGNYDYVVDWRSSGEEIKKCSGSRPQNLQFLFHEGITWSDVSSGPIAVRYMTSGCSFDTCAPTLFNSEHSMYLLGLLNSVIGRVIMNILSPTIHYTCGSMLKFPVLFSSCENEIDKLVAKNIEISKKDWDSFEISWDFNKHPLI